MAVEHPKLTLNLGCGERWMGRGVVNIDFRNLVPPPGAIYLRADVSKLAGYFEPGTIGEIWAHFLLEYIPPDELPTILATWTALLQVGGVVRIKTIALNEVLAAGLADLTDEQRSSLIYGKDHYFGGARCAAFTEEWLGHLLKAAGLAIQESSIQGYVLGCTAVKESNNGAGDVS